MNLNQHIPEISAEMLLNFLYPDLEEKWIAHHDGTFYRNYNRDVLSVNPDEAQVWLSRDSLLRLLPQGLFSPEEELKKGDIVEKHDEIQQRIKLLSEAFLPFDTFSFRRHLKAERNVEELLDGWLSFLLKTYYGIDPDAVRNPYIRSLAVLLPGIRRWRGDFDLLRSLLAAVFHCEVTLQERRYSETDSTRVWIPEVRYELLVPGLSAKEFKILQADILPVRDFLAEWFMPMEVRLEIVAKHHHAAAGVGEQLILGYNTEI